MSPVEMHLDEAVSRFPRVSGDEPATFKNRVVSHRFSPRERG